MKQHQEGYFILMADIISSSRHKGDLLMKQFKEVVNTVNEKHKELLLSPLTITLGDEFQGVALNLEAAIKVIVALEEVIVLQYKPFKLRYVLNFGQIETPINHEIAYGMLGNGLTEARELLEQVKHHRGERFIVKTGNQRQSITLQKTFILYQWLVDAWKPADSQLIGAFLQESDYKVVAEQLGKVRSLMWKREKSLKIKEYLAARDLLHLIASA
ncbi:SatD family protein [Pontibacter sp. 13R65]|uniref:SatD family protein n=1 Tax=Pontibacter sp. 13R65 TaxID=3127458 RepID=UPI00301C963A